VKNGIVSVVCASALLGATSLAFAGAYGEREQPEELPAPVAAAPAAAPAEVPPPGYWFVGAGGLFAIDNFHCDADNAWGYNVRAGRRINDWVAVEAEWEHPVSKFDNADKVDGNGSSTEAPKLGRDIEAWDVTANAKIYPMHGRVQPYGLIGAGYGQANLPHDDINGGFVAKFAIGVDFKITDNFGVDAEGGYLLGTGAMSDYDQIPISIGLFYNFI